MQISDYLDTLTSPFVLEQVTSSNWTSSIYKSTLKNTKSEADRTAADICASVDPIEMLECDLVYMDDTHCHYGNFSMTNGTLQPNGTSWSLYRKPGTVIFLTICQLDDWGKVNKWYGTVYKVSNRDKKRRGKKMSYASELSDHRGFRDK